MTKEITPAFLEEAADKLDDMGLEYDLERAAGGLVASALWIRTCGPVMHWRRWLIATPESIHDARLDRAEREAIDQEAEQAWRTQ